MLKVYGQIIKDQERRGFIEKVKNPDISKGIVHYIPHHPVKKDSTTTPIRIVYDCSCRQSSQLPSLNDCLMNTPPILNELTKILIRFRLNLVAIVTDIEKAFLHVGLHEQDRDVTRFLWLDNPVDPQSDLATYRFNSVLFGATCSPFILNAVLLKHLQQTENKTTKILTRDLYVDNILSSICNETKDVTYFKKARQLMFNAGFNLRSWTSNNENVRNLAIKEDVLDTDKEAKILGMRWNVETGELSYAKRVLSSVSSNITKREILKESSKIFDPLGFLSPVSIRANILMQDLWKERYDWDEPLPENLQLQWKDLAKDIGIVTNDNEETLDEESNTDKNDNLHFGIDKIINANRYGSYKNLLRVTTYVQRFIQNCKTNKSMRNTGEIQPDELQQSTILWIRCCQATAYPGEVRALTLKHMQKTKLPRL
ncbi:uncharacterized protein [Mytilus edulis]|uniref:uncharacterized protein n=1 Tax=Mytilus edulis TaxID=6550 RepID=UPI0039F12C5F